MNKKIFLIVISVLILDQVSKSIISSILTNHESIIVIKDFFSLTYLQNYGVAFGILENNYIIIYIATFACAIALYKFMYSFKENKRNIIAFGLTIGGLIGNLIDRIFFGYVKDFLAFEIGNYHFPIFNISDIGVVVGVLLLMYAVIKGEDKNGISIKDK